MLHASHLAEPPADLRSTAGDLSASDRAVLDEAIGDLQTGSRTWVHLSLDQRARLLHGVHDCVAEVAEEWADLASASKGIDPGHPLRGEEWLGGPYGALVATAALARTLRRLDRGENPLDGVPIANAPGNRLRARVFPGDGSDRLLLSGFSGEVWFEPGATLAELRRGAGLAQRTPHEPGGVGLVLGAGNVTSIPVQDVLTELASHNRVALLKISPLHDVLVPVLQRAFAPLIEPGFLRIVRGGGAVGAYLTAHPGIDHVHITGAAETFDAIVWGPPSGAATRRRREGRPRLTVPITAELGGVSPIIVVPGRWSRADLRFQAEQVVTMRLQNAGHNCIAGQVLVVSEDWEQRDEFLAEVRAVYRSAPHRTNWYPGSDRSLAAAAASYPGAEWCADGTRGYVEIGPADDATALETTEYFAPMLGVVTLRGNGQEFLDSAVAYANDRLAGTLGANIVIDPATEEALGDGFDDAIAELRYGAISVNTWSAFVFLTPTMTWSAFPGGTLDDIGSGTGVVHNALLLDRVERSVARAPFRPFPRSAKALLPGVAGTLSLLPKPPWLVTARTGAAVSEGFTRFRADGDIPRLVRTFVQALRA